MKGISIFEIWLCINSFKCMTPYIKTDIKNLENKFKTIYVK